MAIATPARILTHIAGGIAHKATVRAPLKGLGCYMQPYKGSATIRAKSEPTKTSDKGLPYQKDLYCYADMLYRNRDPAWIKTWAAYYQALKGLKSSVIMGGPKHAKTYEFNAKKDVGRHSFWIKTILSDLLKGFNEKYIKAAWVFTDVTVQDGTLTFTVNYTNNLEGEESLKYFDINTCRQLHLI